MNGRSMGMLIAAVLCGLGAMYGTTKLISKDKTAVQVVEMQDVLVSARDLKVEEMIKPDVVKVVRMPRAGVPVGAFTSVKDVEDRWAQVAILEGEPIVDRKLAARGTPPGLVARIPTGMRAFAIEVNEQTGVSGFVLPGHRVDVVQMESGNNGRPEAEAVLQDVLVLASGQVFTRPDDRSLQSRTVTLAVSPDQVEALVSAKSRGSLTLSLRGLNDHLRLVSSRRKAPAPEPETPKKDPEPKAEVVTVKTPEPPPAVPTAPIPPPPPPVARFVTVYRGLDNMRRIRIDLPPDVNPDEFPAPAPAPTLAQAPATAALSAPTTSPKD